MAQTLRAYLNEVAKEGAFDSQGRFTVDVQRRRMKLREHLFTDPTHYLLCCVRAGVTSGAERVDLKLGYRRAVVCLRNPKELLPRDLLQEVLGSLSAGATEQLLGAAIQGSFAQGCGEVRVTLPGAKVVITPDDMKVTELETGSPDSQCLLEFDFSSAGFLIGRRRCAQESRAVLTRCAFCPIPLFLDGFSVVDGGSWENLFSWQRTTDWYGVHRDFVWVEAFLEGSDGQFEVPPTRRFAKVEYSGGDRFNSQAWWPKAGTTFLRIAPRSRGGRHKTGCFLRLGSLLEGPGRLYLVKQGVVMEPQEVHLGAPGAAVVVRADHLRMDASSFRPVEDAEYQKVVAALQVQTRVLMSQLKRDRKSLTLESKPSPYQALLKGGLMGTGGAMFGGFAGVGGMLLAGGITFLFAGALFMVQHDDRSVVEREKRIRWEIDMYLEGVRPPGEGKLRL